MEKEKKGLFGRLLEFWREKISMGEMDSIGFWHEKADVENRFSEMGAVAVLSQEETKKTFWQEMGKDASEEEMGVFLSETVKEEKTDLLEEAEKMGKQNGSRIFAAEVFQEEKKKETEEKGIGKAFLWEVPEKETEKRSIVPVMEEAAEEKRIVMEEEQEMPKREDMKKEEQQAEPVIDIEKLMRQMTKKLWEERESCGRRLR